MNHSVKALITVFVLGLLAVASFWYVKNTKQDHSDWQTYANTEYGFELKYPADYKLSLTRDVATGLSEGMSLFDISDANGESYMIVSIDVEKGDACADDNFVSSQFAVGNVEVEHIDCQDSLGRGAYLFSAGGHKYDVEIAGSKVALDAFRQILGTFKITTDWQTYTNPKFGYSFSYPQKFVRDNGAQYNWKHTEDGDEVQLAADFPGEGPYFFVKHEAGTMNSVADKFVSDAVKDGSKIEKDEKITFAGQSARHIWVPNEMGGMDNEIFVSNGNGTIVISSGDDQILSTFKFTK